MSVSAMQSGVLPPCGSFWKAAFGLAIAIPLLAISPGERLSSLTVGRWGTPHGIPEETFAAVLA
ncbi:MAG: hypothetical protein ABIO24_09670, partial [Saprospiraceae bacterium]